MKEWKHHSGSIIDTSACNGGLWIGRYVMEHNWRPGEGGGDQFLQISIYRHRLHTADIISWCEAFRLLKGGEREAHRSIKMVIGLFRDWVFICFYLLLEFISHSTLQVGSGWGKTNQNTKWTVKTAINSLKVKIPLKLLNICNLKANSRNLY